MVEWNAEKVSALTTDQIKTLKENAAGKSELLEALCDEELAKRKPKKIKLLKSHDHGETVPLGFHFKCVKGQGLVNDERGVWTGVWVVAKDLAEKAAQAGSYVALHERKAEPSYLQGKILDCRVKPRERRYAEDQEVKTPWGMEFLIEPTDQPYGWVGDSAGERGYAWPEGI